MTTAKIIPSPPVVLLDTHALLWALGDASQLSKRVRALLSDPSVRVLVSAASLWEIATKYRIGKLPEGKLVLDGYPAAIQQLAMIELPVSNLHAMNAGLLTERHKDPFDRMLAAQAILERVPLITNDPLIRTFSGVAVFW